MEQWLSAHDNDVQAIVSENDGMATGAAAALDAQGLLGTVVLSGQDADVAALQRVAAGDQAVSVWKDARLLGTSAGEAAVQLAGGAASPMSKELASSSTPTRNQVRRRF